MFQRAPALPAKGPLRQIVVTSHLPDGSAIRSALAIDPAFETPLRGRRALDRRRRPHVPGKALDFSG